MDDGIDNLIEKALDQHNFELYSDDHQILGFDLGNGVYHFFVNVYDDNSLSQFDVGKLYTSVKAGMATMVKGYAPDWVLGKAISYFMINFYADKDEGIRDAKIICKILAKAGDKDNGRK